MKKVVFLLLLWIFYSTPLLSQGCSDAGFCTIGHVKPSEHDSLQQKSNNLTIISSGGIGELGVLVFSPAIQFEKRFSSRFNIQIKATANSAFGDLGNISGLGDIISSGIYTFKKAGKWYGSITAAVKLPLNNSNLSLNGLSLPMPYQSSLGTTDAIFGYTMVVKKWNFALALQQPIIKNNNNGFLPSHWKKAEANSYIPTNKFQRRADGLVRASYALRPSKNLTFTPGLLAIYHFGNDAYTDSSGNVQTIANSDGLTLNVTFIAKYKLNKKCSIGITVGTPLVVREYRPDGLTRALVISPEFTLNF